MFQMLKKVEDIRFKSYTYFESILVPEKNGKKNSDKSYTKIYQKYVAFSYCYKLVCVDDKFNKLIKSYLGKDAVCNFNNRRKQILWRFWALY